METIALSTAEDTAGHSFFSIGRLMKTEYRHSKAGLFFWQLLGTLWKSISVFTGFGYQIKNTGQLIPLHSLPCWFANLGGNRTQHKRDPYVQIWRSQRWGRSYTRISSHYPDTCSQSCNRTNHTMAEAAHLRAPLTLLVKSHICTSSSSSHTLQSTRHWALHFVQGPVTSQETFLNVIPGLSRVL